MRKIVNILASLFLILLISGTASAQQAPAPLTSFNFTIVGVQMNVGPEYQAVPKGIASQVTTGFTTNGEPLAPEVAAMLPQDFTVTGDLTGPTIVSKLTLTTRAGQPFQLPTFPLAGKYTLSNLRVIDGAGKAFMAAVPQSVTIESINDPLITSVTTHQLTLEEIQQQGIVVDSSNFTVYQFNAAIGTQSNQQPISFPVVIPNQSTLVQNPEPLPQSGVDLNMPTYNEMPPQLPTNVSMEGFMLDAGEGDQQTLQNAGIVSLPPIPGVIIIPNNIGFLNQFFSAMLLVTNGAPGQSNLLVSKLTATISLPTGADRVPGTDAVPGDDPLRMARGASGYFPRTMTVMNAGADGKIGTSDDVSLLHPAESGQADFTIEGRKEGTHKIDFEISATLEGLPIGPITIKGKASGAVLVRNPDFSITLGHPATVRSGEAYDLFITITNTSQTIANLVSTHLDPRALSGAAFAAGEDPDRQIATILPGSSGTVKYRLVSQRTGKVTASAIQSEDESVKGRFILRMEQKGDLAT